jgi:carboxylesterase type B
LLWVQDYISLVGGDPSNVNVLGESAGAGSIMAHLVAFGGKQDPLFKRAIILSPFMEPRIDRAGVLETQFKVFEKAVGCEGQGLACLRNASEGDIRKGASAVFNAAPDHTFAFGYVCL